MIRKMIGGVVGAGVMLGAASTAFAQAAPALVDVVKLTGDKQIAAQAALVNKGDTTWMLVSSVLVLMMSIPGLALFYGGLVRTKNMLSVLMQVFMIVSIAGLLWATYGYSLAFTGGSPFIGGLGKMFMAGVTSGTYAATFSNNVYIPELSYFVFQMTFAMITPALFIGSFAERIKFTPLMLFVVLWSTFVYYPIAHMVWYWAGPDLLYPSVVKDAAGAIVSQDAGYLWGKGALDFAGGTVVHINAGIAGLVGCLMLGKRLGYGKEATPPHSLTMTMIGASLLWVGWFGFNAGSNLESNGVAAVAFVNTMLATCAAAVSWAVIEQIVHKKPSMLGAASGAVAGLVAITPASGYGAPMTSIVLGLVVSPLCFFFVSTVKNKFKYDDTLDVFGVHCIGGITGAIATAIVAAPALGGQGVIDYTVFPSVPAFTAETYNTVAQLQVQIEAVLITLVWSGLGTAIIWFVLDKTLGMRISEEGEREGLDIADHGERAYNY